MLRTHRNLEAYWATLSWKLFFLFFRVMEHRWNETDRENRSTRGETCPSATFSTTNPKLTDPGSNPGLRGVRPATSSLSHGTNSCTLTKRQFWHYSLSDVQFYCSLWTAQPLVTKLEVNNIQFKWQVTEFIPGRHTSHFLCGGNFVILTMDPADSSEKSVLSTREVHGAEFRKAVICTWASENM
jgi:hypothetical protein